MTECGPVTFLAPLLIVLSVFGTVSGRQCADPMYYEVGDTIQTIKSPHNNGVDYCKWVLRTRRFNGTIYVRLSFPPLSALSYPPDCSKTYVDVYDGSETNSRMLGRWCDMDSSLMISSGQMITVLSYSHWYTSATFTFELHFCLDPFDKRPLTTSTQDSKLSRGAIAGIAIALFLAICITLCVVKKYRYLCRNTARGRQTRAETPRPSPYVITFSPSPNPPQQGGLSPPDYWTVVRPGGRHKPNEDQPPPYSEVAAWAQL